MVSSIDFQLTTKEDQVLDLIDALERVDHDSRYDKFVSCLYETDQGEAAKMLEVKEMCPPPGASCQEEASSG